MRRRLLNISAVFSLLLLVAVVTLWVRNGWRADTVLLTQVGHGNIFAITSADGDMNFWWIAHPRLPALHITSISAPWEQWNTMAEIQLGMLFCGGGIGPCFRR